MYQLASYVVGLEITSAGINSKEAAFLLSITIGPSMMREAQISTKTLWVVQLKNVRKGGGNIFKF